LLVFAGLVCLRDLDGFWIGRDGGLSCRGHLGLHLFVDLESIGTDVVWSYSDICIYYSISCLVTYASGFGVSFTYMMKFDKDGLCSRNFLSFDIGRRQAVLRS
jgi:hypothetical protein